MYKVIGSVKSRTFRVLWMLEEMGIPYEHMSTSPHSEEVKDYNPSGKVPVLLDGETVITDSNAIMTYLADKHGMMTEKSGTIARAHQDALLHQIIDEVDALLWASSRSSLGLNKLENFSLIRQAFELEYEQNIERLAKKIKGPFLMGKQLTIPDFVLGHCGGWAYVAKFPCHNEGFKIYLKNLRSRSSYQEAAALGQNKTS
ncbi:MAG: glutathione S-transferase [Rhodobacteraceae bacterium]|nr:glutathione S-transferase [Paracoccaceae bacterium]